MHPEQIKAELRMAGVTLAAIADELGLSRTTVSQVLHGKSVSARISTRISEVLGKPVATIWPKHRTINRVRPHHHSGGAK
ncbi:MAG: transcriptional regulator [Ottowia sp.]|jgi:hypothetical protein